jgi:Phage tail lysozyme
MSGAQTSTFPTMNELLAPMAAYDVHQNQLLNQQTTQRALNADEIEQISRAANWVVSQDPENKDPGKQAQAYSTAVGILQKNNYAKNAPAEYPGFGAMQMYARLGTPSADQYKLGLGQQAVTGAIGALSPDGYTGAPGQGAAAPPGGGGTTSGTAAAPGTIEPDAVSRANAVRDGLMKRGLDYDTATAFAANALHESSANPNTGAGDAGASHGLFQWRGDRAAAYQQAYGHSPDNAPLDEQLDFVMRELKGSESLARDRITQAQGPEGKAAQVSEAYLRPKDVAAEMARRSATAKQLAALGPAPATPGMTDQQWLANLGRQYPSLASAGAGTPGQVPAAPGAAPPPAPYQVATAGATVPGPPTAPPAAAPAIPAPPQNQVMPGQPNGPPAIASPVAQPPPPPAQAARATAPPATPPPAAPAAAPAATPPPTVAAVTPTAAPPAVPQMVTPGGQPLPGPPQAPAVLSNGLTPQQWGLIQSQLKLAAAGGPGAVQQVLAQIPTLVNANRTALQQAWADTHPDLHFTQTADGILAQDPKSGRTVGFTPAAPNMQSRSTEGTAVWDGTKWVQGGPNDTPGKWVIAGDKPVTFLPASSRPAAATFDLQKDLHRRDTDALPEYNTQNQTAASNMVRIQQMRELVDQISTGAGGAERANWANIADTMGWTDLAKRLVGMGGAAAAQEFAKYGLATAGAQERGDLGARGSLGAINLYKSANPNLELQPDANKKMLTAQLIAAQANRDYTQGAMDYVNRNGDAFLRGGNYTPLSHFDADWAAARNPIIYAAAMGAINGDLWQKWTKALNMKSPDDVQRVIDIVRRADPTSTVMWNNGEPHAVGTGQ